MAKPQTKAVETAPVAPIENIAKTIAVKTFLNGRGITNGYNTTEQFKNTELSQDKLNALNSLLI